MNSLMLQVGSRVLVPGIVLLSLFLLFRGHNEPGGGFIGGLMLALGTVLFMLGNGCDRTRRVLRADPLHYLSAGLLAAFVSGLPALFVGMEFMRAFWGFYIFVPLVGWAKTGTVMLFDVGVYLLVFGTIVQVVMLLLETEEE